jgi:hypothetical protein
MKLVKLFCVMACATSAGAAPMPPRQSDTSFEAAIHNQSTAPSYVLITVVDANTGASQSTCTTANLLLGAIHLEVGIGYDREGQSAAMQIALTNERHVFSFEKRKALDNIPRYYSDEDLAYVRKAVQGLSVPQVLDAIASQGPLHDLLQGATQSGTLPTAMPRPAFS